MECKPFLRAFQKGVVKLGEGMASTFNWMFYSLRAFSYKESFGTDTESLISDWQKVGEDIGNAIKQFEKETEGSSK